jgi:hypothetical protein
LHRFTQEVATEAAGVIEFPLACAELLDVLIRAGSGLPGAPPHVRVSWQPWAWGWHMISVENQQNPIPVLLHAWQLVVV